MFSFSFLVWPACLFLFGVVFPFGSLCFIALVGYFWLEDVSDVVVEDRDRIGPAHRERDESERSKIGRAHV